MDDDDIDIREEGKTKRGAGNFTRGAVRKKNIMIATGEELENEGEVSHESQEQEHYQYSLPEHLLKSDF